MDTLAALDDAQAIILSCPGPLRRHAAALMPLANATLPQVLLGSESQLLGFAAAMPHLEGRLFFAPLPEMFPDAASLRRAVQRAGGQVHNEGGREGGREGGDEGPRSLVHLRFGSVRAARVLKGAFNACVIAEASGASPLTASHHPFASGLVLPASIRRLYVYGPDSLRPVTIGGAALPVSRLPPDCVLADLRCRPEPEPMRGDGGLDMVSLAEFRSFAWAAGPVRARGAKALLAERGGAPAVLLPWNMDHPGSIVPTLLERLASLQSPSGPAAVPRVEKAAVPRVEKAAVPRVEKAAVPRVDRAAVPHIVLLPFNYVGQTGIIRRLITRLKEVAGDADALLASVFVARLGTLAAVGSLRRVAATAWVDGNDPEAWWTLARLEACGFATILIDPAFQAGAFPTGGGRRLAADEAIWVEAETRCGALTFAARLPSLRALPRLLALTASGGERKAGRRRRGAAARFGAPAKAAP